LVGVKADSVGEGLGNLVTVLRDVTDLAAAKP
jgi:hypothetical protein